MLKKLFCLVISGILTLGISAVAFANDNVGKLSEQTQVKTISRDEFLKTYADEHNISFSEADKRDKQDTLHMLQEENKKHGYGDYQKFSEITSNGVKPSGSGTATLEDIAFTTRIGTDFGYENEIIMLYDGIVEHAVSASLTGDATKAGFTIRGNVGTTYYCRKPVKIDYTFYSNANLN